MSGAGVMRVKKLKGNGIITVAVRHNKRVIQAELGATGSIDPSRSHLNEALKGPTTAADVGQFAKDLMKAAGVVKLRKDAVMGLEFVFSLPHGHTLDDRAYFAACAEWVGTAFGGVILSADVHRDEAAPHCHVLLLPLIEGRMIGNKIIGGKPKLMALQKDFHANVASKFGLSKASARLSGSAKQATAKAVLQKLRETTDGALRSVVWAVIRDAVERDPAPFLLALGLALAPAEKPARTMTQIFTSKGKGRAKESSNAIAFAPSEKDRRLCSVAFAPKPAPGPVPKAPAPHLPDDAHDLDLERLDGGDLETVRLRDSDLDPALYDTATGDYFRRPAAPARHQRQAADEWVATACAAAGRH